MPRARYALVLLLAFASALIEAASAQAETVRVSGRVTAEDGRPLAGARVTLSRPAASCVWVEGSAAADRPAEQRAPLPPLPPATPFVPTAQAAAGADGRFLLQAPEPGIWLLTAEAPGHLARELLLDALLEPVELDPAVLPRDIGLEVWVAGPEGPVAARVLAVPEVRPQTWFDAGAAPASDWRSPARRLAGPTASGILRLPWSAGERLRLVAAAPGLALTQTDVEAGTPVRLALSAGPVRAVRALDERGSPVAGAVVCTADGLALGRADAQGRWSGAVPASGSLGLELRGPEGLAGSLLLTGAASATRAGAGGTAGEREIRLRRPAAVAGRVLDGESRRPVPGALIWLGDRPETAVRTNREGGYTLAVPAAAESGYFLRAAAPGYLPVVAMLAAREGREGREGRGGSVTGAGRANRGPTVLLERAAALAGVVVDRSGGPVDGAELRLVQAGPVDKAPLDLAGRSGSDGGFRLAGVPARGRFTLLCRKAGLAPARVPVERGGAAGQGGGPLRVVLAPGLAAGGRVVDPAGAPVAGARVTLRPGLGAVPFLSGGTGEEWTAEADTGGRFRLAGLLPGHYELETAAPGFARRVVPGIGVTEEVTEATGPGGGEEVDLGTVALTPGLVLEGEVVDGAGRPLPAPPAVEIEVLHHPRALRFGPPEVERLTAGPDGRFRVPDLAAGEVLNLTFYKPGYAARPVQDVTVPAAPLRVVLTPAGRIRGRVLDAQGQPVAGAHILVESPDGGTGAREPSDGAGEFAAEGVAPGEVTLHVQAPGYLAARLAGLEVPAGGELAGVEVVLERGATIEGRVTDPRGRPVEGAAVQASDGSGGERLNGDFAAGLSDGDGVFRLSGVPVGLATLQAYHNRFGHAWAELEVRPGSNAADLAFATVFEISGRVIDGADRPVADTGVYLQATGRDAPGGTTTDADGAFVIPAVPPGSYVLLAAVGGALRWSGLPVTVVDGPVAGLELRVERGATVLRGRLLGLAVEELASVQVHANGGGQPLIGGALPDNTYTVEGLAAGRWSISAVLPEPGGVREAHGEVEVPAGAAEVSLDLAFEEEPEVSGFTVTGVVRRAGQPVAGAAVGLGNRSARTDSAGGFRLERVAAGSHQLTVQLPSGLVHVEIVEVEEDRSIEVDVVAARLAGRVVEAAGGRPLAGARIRWETLDGSPALGGADAGVLAGGIESDARGLFFAEVAPGRFRVMAERRGYAAAEATVEVGEGGGEVEIRLEPAEVLVLAVAHADGRTPQGVTLAALDGAGRVVASGRFTPGTDGRVRVSTVPAGTWQLLAVADGSGTAGLLAAVPGEAGPLALPPAGSLVVQVPELSAGGDAADGADGADGADNAAGAEGDEGGPPAAAVTAVLTLTDAAGRPLQMLDEWSERVSASWPVQLGTAALGGVAAGRYAATVTAADGRGWSGVVDIAPGGQARLVLR
jgi:Carboxypeptidase regulatory-like domain